MVNETIKTSCKGAGEEFQYHVISFYLNASFFCHMRFTPSRFCLDGIHFEGFLPRFICFKIDRLISILLMARFLEHLAPDYSLQIFLVNARPRAQKRNYIIELIALIDLA